MVQFSQRFPEPEIVASLARQSSWTCFRELPPLVKLASSTQVKALALCYFLCMGASTTLTIRVDAEIKEAARARAQKLGISLGTLVENDLRQFINGRPIIIDDDSFVPTERLKADIQAAREDRENGDYEVAGPDELGGYLDKLKNAADEN